MHSLSSWNDVVINNLKVEGVDKINTKLRW